MTAQKTSLFNAFETQLSASVGAADLTFNVDATAPLTSPCYLAIDPTSASKREYVLFDGTFTSTAFVTSSTANRGLGGSAAGAQAHAAGTTVRCVPMHQHFGDLNDRIDNVLNGTSDFTGTVDMATVNIDSLRVKGPWFDITHPDYGAVADAGTTDNTAAINAAITACEAAGGGLVFIPAGDFGFASNLLLDTNGVAIIGVGPKVSVLRYTGGAGDAISITAQALCGFANVRIRNTGTGSNGVVVAHAGATTGYRYEFHNVQIDGFGNYGLWGRNVELSRFEQVDVSGNGSHGIVMDNSTHTGSASGISNVWIRCRANSNTGSGWSIANQAANEFIGCQSLQNATPQFNLAGSSRGCKVSALDIENDGTGVGLAVSGSEHEISVAGYNLATGIALTAATRCFVKSSQFATVTTPVTLNATSTDNIVFGTGYTVTNSGSNNTVLHTGARASTIGSSWAQFQDGTGAVPALSFSADPDTGFFREAADFIGVATGGTRRFGFDANRFFTTSGHAVEVGGALDHNGTTVGFYGVAPVTRPTALTAADAATVDATYGTEEAGVINNLRTRVNELESKLQSLGLLT